MRLPISTSYLRHTYIGIFSSIWLIIFLVIIAPFDTSDLILKYRLQLMPVYGMIAFMGYMVLIPFQNMFYNRFKNWTIPFEITFMILYNLLVLPLCFSWYTSDAVNGTFPFSQFALEVYNPTFIMLLFVLIVARWFIWPDRKVNDQKKITLTGDNKLDILKINLDNLLCISSADNYVEINYLNNGQLAKKLLRNTLKNMERDVDGLVQVHRSYLINPAHFLEWKNSSTISITQMEVPVTKTYKKNLSHLENRP